MMRWLGMIQETYLDRNVVLNLQQICLIIKRREREKEKEKEKEIEERKCGFARQIR